MTTLTKPKAQFGCPHCKGGNIHENNVVGIRLRVDEWTNDGEPASFAYPWHIKDETVTTDPENPRYHCEDCNMEFDEVANLNLPELGNVTDEHSN
jgi:hypothetical protein